MATSPVKTVFIKELRDLYRDRRTLMVTVVLPLLMYPLIFIGVLQLTLLQAGKLKQKTGVVALLSPSDLPATLIREDSTLLIDLVDSTDWREKLRAGELDAALALSPGFSDSIAQGRVAEVKLHYLSSRDFSDQVSRRLQTALEEFQASVVDHRMASLGLDSSYIHPVAFESVDEATEAEQTGSNMGRFLGYFLIIMTLTGAFYAAIDLTAGEKERGTLETLLVSPASRRELVYGKFLATVVAALLTAILNLVSMGFTALYAARMVDSGGNIGISISWPSLLLVLVVLIPLAVLFAGVSLAVAVTARSYKEGQGLLTPLIMVSVLPAMVSIIPGVELTPLLAVVPIANVSLLTRALMAGQTPVLELFITLLSTATLAALSLQWVTTQFNRESVLFRHAEDVKWSPFTKPVREIGKRLTPGSVALLAAVAVIVVGGVGGMAGAASPVQGVLIVQGALVALAALWVYRGGYDPAVAFGWKAASARAWLGAFLAVAGGWVLTIQLATLQHMFFPFPEEMLEQFRDLFAGLDDLPFWQGIVLIAVLPAVVEEHLCRGLMLRGLEDKSGNWRGIVVVALIFAILHLNPYRLLPTFGLGLLLGYIAIQTRSIFPAILGHFINNAASVTVYQYEEQMTAWGWASDEAAWVPWPWLIAGAVLFAIGVVLLRTLPSSESGQRTVVG